MKKLLLLDSNADSLTELQKTLEESSYHVVDHATNGRVAIQKIQEIVPDAIIMDLMLSEVDGFEVLEQLKSLPKTPFVIVTSAISNDVYVQKALNLGAIYYIIKPFPATMLIKRLDDLFCPPQITEQPQKNDIALKKKIDERISNIFLTLGIPAHIKGYTFLREAVKLVVENPDWVSTITKKIYPTVAQTYQTTASKVERSIRHAIEVGWQKKRLEQINQLFGIKVYADDYRPTNGEFIALIADKIIFEFFHDFY